MPFYVHWRDDETFTVETSPQDPDDYIAYETPQAARAAARRSLREHPPGSITRER